MCMSPLTAGTSFSLNYKLFRKLKKNEYLGIHRLFGTVRIWLPVHDPEFVFFLSQVKREPPKDAEELFKSHKMWNCRVCSSTPFASFFGLGGGTEKDKKDKQRRSSATSETNSVSGGSDGDSVYTDDRFNSRETFDPRSPEEILTLCRAWENYVHPRAKEFWQTSDELLDILKKIASGVHRNYDPVLGDDRQCVIWHGDLSEDDKLPIIRMVKPGESVESQTHVNRTLVFLYADEESFNELHEKPKKAFTMACGNPLCINLTHIALDD